MLVAPRHVERVDFFDSFYEMLCKEKGVSGVRAIPEAYVPVIKLEFEGIEVCSLSLSFYDSILPHTIPTLDGSPVCKASSSCYPLQLKPLGC